VAAADGGLTRWMRDATFDINLWAALAFSERSFFSGCRKLSLNADSLFMSNPSPMWVYDLETLRFLAVNNAAVATYRYSREEFLAMTIADIRPAEDRDALLKSVAAVTEGFSNSGVWRHCLKSGQVIYVDIAGHTVTWEGRKAELITARDVSRLVIAEQTALDALTEQRVQNEQLRLLEAAACRLNDILLITDAEPITGPDGPRIVYVNDAFERHTGYSREEVIGQTPRILHGLKTQPVELERIRQALEKWQPVRAELINYTKSGEEFWLELDIVPLADDAGWYTHWIAVERNITARKKTDLALQNSLERFRLVTRAAGIAIWDWDANTDKIWWSEGLHDVFGHAINSADSFENSWRRFIHPDDLARIDNAVQRVISGQDHAMVLEYRFRRADGSWAIVEDNCFATFDESGKIQRVLGSMTDLSEKKHLEERLRQAQKMEAVGQLTGGLAHDFNNLLTVIMGNAEILQEELRDFPHLQELAGVSLGAAESGAELTSRLLAFSRKQFLQPKIIDVAQLIEGLDGLLRRTLPENINIEIIRSGGLWKIEADAPQLESALLNLAVNARDAMPEGGYLTIEIANTILGDDYVAMEPDAKAGEYVQIVVTDSGCGMEPNVLDRVFEPFFTTKAVGEGSGLGLSMIFGFVKQSGGHVRIYSEPDEGTAIKMYFPRIHTANGPASGVNSERMVIGGTETILIVEDNDDVRKYVTKQLISLGYNVLETSNGIGAMEILRQDIEIDLLFTDVVMPGGLGGRELAEAACKIRPGLKVLYTSGYTENSIAHQGRLDPGIQLLNKPYRRDKLAAKLREMFED
jgi:PAS domain S-box-containing protein